MNEITNFGAQQGKALVDHFYNEITFKIEYPETKGETFTSTPTGNEDNLTEEQKHIKGMFSDAIVKTILKLFKIGHSRVTGCFNWSTNKGRAFMVTAWSSLRYIVKFFLSKTDNCL